MFLTFDDNWASILINCMSFFATINVLFFVVELLLRIYDLHTIHLCLIIDNK